MLWSRHWTEVDGGRHFAIFEGDFADAAAMAAARASPQGQRVALDVANYATGGAVVIHYPVQDGAG